MYSYAWDKVSCQNLIRLAARDNFSSLNIMAKLLLLCLRQIVKRGLYRNYNSQVATLPLVRGRIKFASTCAKMGWERAQINCEYDVFLENNRFNQILKYTILKLLHASDLNLQLRRELRSFVTYFMNVDYREITASDFDRLDFNRQNQYYSFAIKVCQLILEAHMLSAQTGDFDFDNLFENKKIMAQVFELFVYRFYEINLPKQLYEVSHHDRLKFHLLGGEQKLLPDMETDIQIKNPLETLIIDTKFYKDYLASHTQYQDSQEKYHSGNLYQLLCYLNSINSKNDLRGILLYPKPYARPSLHESYQTEVIADGRVKPAKLQLFTLDLSVDWPEIDQQLLDIIFAN